MIFVTSLPRCGSTWVGNVLSGALGCPMLHEPFNWKSHPERERFHMRYMPADRGDPEIVECLLADVAKALDPRPDGLCVVKDVHTCLSLEYVAAQTGMQVVVLVRHPCGMARSWMELGYKVDFRIDLLLSQPSLLAEHLGNHERHLRSSTDPWFQLGAYWGAAYQVVHNLSARHPEWVWCTHESLCEHPERQFARILDGLGVAPVQDLAAIVRATDAAKDGNKPYSIKRNIKDQPGKWKRALTNEQRSAIEAGSSAFAVFRSLYPAG
jgi:hypothetical protein